MEDFTLNLQNWEDEEEKENEEEEEKDEERRERISQHKMINTKDTEAGWEEAGVCLVISL